MVLIPKIIKEFIDSQGIFVVGSVGKNKFANVSPRIFFEVRTDSIFWLDFFHHKSYRNFRANPRVTVSVYDKERLKGYQIRGLVSFIIAEPMKTKIRDEIITKTIKLFRSEKVKKMATRSAEVIMFRPKIIYSLDPEEFSDLSISSEVDVTQLFTHKKRRA